MKRLFLLLLLCFCICEVKAADAKEKYNVIYNYSSDWLEYNHEDNVYIPFAKKVDKEFQTYSLEIVPSDYPRAFLIVKTPPSGANIFIDNKLNKVSKKSETVVFNLDKLSKAAKKGKIYLSFFSADLPSETSVYIGYPASSEEPQKVKSGEKEVIKLLPRPSSKYNSGIAVAFLVGFIMMSFVSSNYLRVYVKYYSLGDVFSTKVKDDLFLIGKPLDRPSLLFVILLSIVIGAIVLLLEANGLDMYKDSFIFQSGNTFGTYVVNFFKSCLLAFVVLIAKYFFLNIVGKLFNLSRITDIHYFKEIQFSLYLSSLLLVVLLVLYNIYLPLSEDAGNYLIIGLVVFFTLRTCLIYFTINRESNTKFLYLFSYLCVAEALPVILGIRFLF